MIKTEKFSTKCLENNYIENNLLCPIKDIKFEKEQNEKYNDYSKIQINDNEYLYYTNDYMSGKL